MTRSLTTAVKNELATNDIRPIHLITINFATPINLTDNSFSLTSSVSGSSVTYTSSAFVLDVSNFTEEIDITKTTLSLSLSGADQTFISTALGENITNDQVTIFRGLLADDNTLIADPFLLYKGNIDGFNISESETSSVDKKNGRKTNNTSQKRFFSTDVGMDFSSQTVLDIKWGRA